MRLVDPSTPTLVLTADGKLFFPVIDPPYFLFFLFKEGKNLVRFVLNIFTDKRFLNGKSKIDDRKILKESSIYVIDNVFKNKFAH